MSALIRLIPFWIIGIVAAWNISSLDFFRPVWFIYLWLASLVLSLISLWRSSGGIPLFSIHIIILVFLSAFLLAGLSSSGMNLKTGEEIQIIGKVLKVFPGNRSERIKMRVARYKYAGEEFKSREIVMIQSGLKLPPALLPGDYLLCDVSLDNVKRRKSSGDFPEKLYLAGEGVRKKGWIKQLSYPGLLPRQNGKLIYKGTQIREKLSGWLESNLKGDGHAALVKAMLLGNKDSLSSETKELFRQTGISHLLAVSGLHVGLIYLFFIRLFFPLKATRAGLIVEIVAVLAVWFYSYITGFGASVQRAAGMITLFAFSRSLKRRVLPLQILVVAFYLQSSMDSNAIFRFGFQLSYLAVAGILIFYNRWSKISPLKNVIFRKIWNFAGVSISAQSFTLPFILLYFKEFPLYFILGNMLLVPIGLLVFYFGALYLIILTAGINLSFLGKLLDLLIDIMSTLGDKIAGLPFSILKFENFDTLHLILYFIILIFIFSTKSSYYSKLLSFLITGLIISVLKVLYVLW